MKPGHWILIYDGECEFCRRQIERVRRWNGGGRIEPVPFQSAELERYGVSRAAAERAMHLVALSGEVWSGAEAAREVLRLLPRARPLAWTLGLPGMMWLAERIYRWVARRRHRFGCGSDVCRRGS